ncbi:hypothetical protein Z957_05250 [Clostridium sp. K25]|uniref:hypothetical protein n=1 Tax=Clostridium sp. K25 TaxID=1443109 RepID=UPI0004D504ED|nr:hypothetical protein [Clostridium sp. K25]KEI09310.1 hypothetical protein Z957_05250 [Clostridium sp. K25]
MNKLTFVEWFGIISGIASIISLIMTFMVNNKVTNINKQINNSTDNSNLTVGDESPIQKNHSGNNYYKGGK